MPRIISFRFLIPVALLICFMLGSLTAAPILRRPKVFDELRAFADIPRLQIEIDPLPQALTDVGLYSSMIRQHIEDTLQESNIHVTDDTSLPKLHVKSVTMSSERYPDAVGFILFLDLVQKIYIPRLDTDLLLPTATIPMYAIKPKADLARAFLDTVGKGLVQVTNAIQLASAERARPDGENAGQ